jgi:arylsulfatase A-like enzyme
MTMTRRALAYAPFLHLSARGQRTEKPNVLFLYADDMRADALGAMGNREVRTPNLDKLAARGTVFEKAYNQGGHVGAVCIASRAMLMSGKSLWRATGPNGLSGTLMPRRFAEAGYQTFVTGKWHNGAEALKAAFDDGGPVLMGGMGPQVGLRMASFAEPGKASAREGRVTPLLADALMEFLGRPSTGKQPFFAYGAFTAPHDPREASAEDAAFYKGAQLTLPKPWKPAPVLDNGELKVRDEMVVPAPRTQEQCVQELRDYYALITELDRNLGRVMGKLEERGMLGNTIILFAADNGLAMGAHGLMGKQNMHEHSLRVPMMVAGPRGKSVREKTPRYLYSSYSHLCGMAGLSVPRGVEANAPEHLYFGYRHLQRAVQVKGRKMVWNQASKGMVREQYDLRKDPFEENNLHGTPAEWDAKPFELAANAAKEFFGDAAR